MPINFLYAHYDLSSIHLRPPPYLSQLASSVDGKGRQKTEENSLKPALSETRCAVTDAPLKMFWAPLNLTFAKR